MAAFRFSFLSFVQPHARALLHSLQRTDQQQRSQILCCWSEFWGDAHTGSILGVVRAWRLREFTRMNLIPKV
eukprot:807138-Rhodomonas_salina.2